MTHQQQNSYLQRQLRLARKRGTSQYRARQARNRRLRALYGKVVKWV